MSDFVDKKQLIMALKAGHFTLQGIMQSIEDGYFDADCPPEKSCETCGHKPAFGSPTLLAVHCLICKDGCSQWEKIVVADQKKSMCDWHHDSIKRLGLLFDELGRKVKALEDQHGDIPKVTPVCPKPCYCKFPGQLPAVCYNTCAGTHCVYHKEHKG
jgi:hypothetical protein